MARVFFAGYDVAGKLALWVTHGTAAIRARLPRTWPIRPAWVQVFSRPLRSLIVPRKR
jgi:hypothetical protein